MEIQVSGYLNFHFKSRPLLNKWMQKISHADQTSENLSSRMIYS